MNLFKIVVFAPSFCQVEFSPGQIGRQVYLRPIKKQAVCQTGPVTGNRTFDWFFVRLPSPFPSSPLEIAQQLSNRTPLPSSLFAAPLSALAGAVVRQSAKYTFDWHKRKTRSSADCSTFTKSFAHFNSGIVTGADQRSAESTESRRAIVTVLGEHCQAAFCRYSW